MMLFMLNRTGETKLYLDTRLVFPKPKNISLILIHDHIQNFDSTEVFKLPAIKSVGCN